MRHAISGSPRKDVQNMMFLNRGAAPKPPAQPPRPPRRASTHHKERDEAKRSKSAESPKKREEKRENAFLQDIMSKREAQSRKLEKARHVVQEACKKPWPEDVRGFLKKEDVYGFCHEEPLQHIDKDKATIDGAVAQVAAKVAATNAAREKAMREAEHMLAEVHKVSGAPSALRNPDVTAELLQKLAREQRASFEQAEQERRQAAQAGASAEAQIAATTRNLRLLDNKAVLALNVAAALRDAKPELEATRPFDRLIHLCASDKGCPLHEAEEVMKGISIWNEALLFSVARTAYLKTQNEQLAAGIDKVEKHLTERAAVVAAQLSPPEDGAGAAGVDHLGHADARSMRLLELSLAAFRKLHGKRDDLHKRLESAREQEHKVREAGKALRKTIENVNERLARAEAAFKEAESHAAEAKAGIEHVKALQALGEERDDEGDEAEKKKPREGSKSRDGTPSRARSSRHKSSRQKSPRQQGPRQQSAPRAAGAP